MRACPENGNAPEGENPVGEYDAPTLALMALGWLLGEQGRAQRLLALTGLDPDSLRDGVGRPEILSEILGFLANHEPDLIACAAALDVRPERLVAARRELLA